MVWRTATTSLPSTWMPGMPAATAFWASVFVAVWISSGTEMAQRLLTVTNTAGSRRTPATFRAS